MLAKETNARYKVEMKFKNGVKTFVSNENYETACLWYDVLKDNHDDYLSRNMLEAVLYDGDKPLAAWCNSKALVA